MASKSKVYFFFDDVNITLKERNRLKKLIELIFRRENKMLYQLNYIFCSDKKLLDINKKYLRHNFYTDIITFDLSENENQISGEVYISTERVRDNAKNIGEYLQTELLRVIFHGALHLCGFKDKSPNEIMEIRKKEDEYLKEYFRVPRDTVST